MTSQSTRALSQAEIANVKRHLDVLVDKYGSEMAVGSKVGVAQQTINRIRRGFSAPSYYTAKLIARHMRIDVGVLLNSKVALLDELVPDNPGRWSPVTVNAVRVMRGADELDRRGLEWLLDQTEEALSPMNDWVEEASRKHRATR